MHSEDLQTWFNKVQDVLERAYLSHDEPRRQSSMSGPYERWTAKRGIMIEPYSLDLSPSLISHAKQLLPQLADCMNVGDAFEWIPPERFDNVRTELLYVLANTVMMLN